ncbi:MAG: membrane protein, partial [Sulfurovum sp. AS07-7]
GLQLIGILTAGIAFIIAIVLNYIKKDDVIGTCLESHFEWQIRTFWTALIWSAIGFILAITVVLLPVAWIIWFVVTVWVIYRALKGLLNLLENKPMLIQAKVA